MKNDKIIPGAILIMIGAAMLLHNYGVLSIHWHNVFYLWPVFIVIGGINLIFAHNRSGWATALKLGVIIAGFGMVLFGNFGKHTGWWHGSAFPYNESYDEEDMGRFGGHGIIKNEGDKLFTEPYTKTVKVAQLNISGGGASYTLSDTTNQLVSADSKIFGNDFTNYLSRYNSDSIAVLTYKMKSHGFDFGGNDDDDKQDNKFGRNRKSNAVIFRLNPNPQWDINIKTGAANVDFDLSKFKVSSVNLSGGAASFNVKLGQPLAVTNVKVETGMSQTTISIPVSAACHITSSTGMSSTSFDGFTKTHDNAYETPGFNAAKNKIYIKMTGGMADFKVKRY